MTDASKAHRAELRQAYKEASPPAGVYAIRDLQTGEVRLGASMNAPGMLNRIRFQLDAGMYREDPALQAAWKAHGAARFSFEVLDLLPPPKEAEVDLAAELEVLLAMWREKLAQPR